MCVRSFNETIFNEINLCETATFAYSSEFLESAT